MKTQDRLNQTPVPELKAESAILIAVAICIFLSFYFSLLSFMTTEDMIKRQFVLIAVYSILSSIIIFGFLLLYLIMRKVFTRAT